MKWTNLVILAVLLMILSQLRDVNVWETALILVMFFAFSIIEYWQDAIVADHSKMIRRLEKKIDRILKLLKKLEVARDKG